MDQRSPKDKSKNRRLAIALWASASLFTAYAIPAFLLKYFNMGQVLALLSFVFLEILVVLSVSRMDRDFEEFELSVDED